MKFHLLICCTTDRAFGAPSDFELVLPRISLRRIRGCYWLCRWHKSALEPIKTLLTHVDLLLFSDSFNPTIIMLIGSPECNSGFRMISLTKECQRHDLYWKRPFKKFTTSPRCGRFFATTFGVRKKPQRLNTLHCCAATRNKQLQIPSLLQ